MTAYLIVCPLVFLAGLVDSIAGGGGIISLPAYMLAGVPAHSALGTNKMGSTMGTIVSTLRYAGHGYLKGKVVMALCSAAVSYTHLDVYKRQGFAVRDSGSQPFQAEPADTGAEGGGHKPH